VHTCAEVAEEHLETVEAHESEVAQLVVQLAVIHRTRGTAISRLAGLVDTQRQARGRRRTCMPRAWLSAMVWWAYLE
jgi:hypothetical protein